MVCLGTKLFFSPSLNVIWCEVSQLCLQLGAKTARDYRAWEQGGGFTVHYKHEEISEASLNEALSRSVGPLASKRQLCVQDKHQLLQSQNICRTLIIWATNLPSVSHKTKKYKACQTELFASLDWLCVALWWTRNLQCTLPFAPTAGDRHQLHITQFLLRGYIKMGYWKHHQVSPS